MNAQPLKLLTLALVVSLTAACATAPADGERIRRDANLITQEELATLQTGTLHDAVQRLRPRWLEARGARTVDAREGDIVVYLDNTFIGGPEALRQFNIDAAFAIRYMDPPTAQGRLPGLGGRSIEGAIQIVTAERHLR
jgi:hypothetical protein